MKKKIEDRAIIYCQGAFNKPTGKTAHGLIRFSHRYEILSVVDSTSAGKDTGVILDGKANGIMIYQNLGQALKIALQENRSATHMVIGLAPDGGRLPAHAVDDIKEAIVNGLNIDSGLHDFLSDHIPLARLARKHGVRIRDIRKPPTREKLHFFSGKINQITSLRIAMLGTDSAIGKRTSAWILSKGLAEAGYRNEMIGTGQTAWMQGCRYGIILDSLVNDFVAGEVEHVVWSAWKKKSPDIIIIEGQGSLLNPAYPGGFEILAAARPHLIILQHAPMRRDYDGFPGYPIHPLHQQIEALEIISKAPVAAITLNHELMTKEKIPYFCQAIQAISGIPTHDVLLEGPSPLVESLHPYLKHIK